MPKTKHRKDHKKKVAARNEKLKQEKSRFQKIQREMLMNMIEQERQKGLFDNTPEIPSIPSVIPTDTNLDGPNFGPLI
jgi:hypothetical protein